MPQPAAYLANWFSTTMTGYQHSLTNPSNAATIMVFTFPHIETLVNAADAESDPTGQMAVIRDPARTAQIGNPNSTGRSVEKSKVVGISGLIPVR